MPELPARQVPAVYHRRLGEMIVTAVSDGYVDPPAGAAFGVSQEEADRMLIAGMGSTALRISVNCFLLRMPGRTCLVDVGSGTTMGPTCGRLFENLLVAGLTPADIDTVLLTHIHPDHSNGLTSDEGQPLFPRAEIVVHENEMSHWFDDAAMAAANERARTRYFASARFRMAPYRDRIRTFRDGEVLPGIVAVPCHGHTPGHTAFRISSAGEDLLIWGDTVHMAELQVPRPDITMIYDSDQPAAAASRRAIFDLAVRDNLLVTGMHVHFPGFARMSRQDGQYRLLPEPWVYEL